MTVMSELPHDVLGIDTIDESGPFVGLSREVDLDDLLLVLAAREIRDGYIDVRQDDETSLPGYESREAKVGWFRKSFCVCGEEHSFDLMHVGDEKPEGSKARGAFLGVWFA